ncbi:hypothetical protein PNI0212_01948 [Streptococcus pneumoniae PNI0212]|nr:hypothetical protein PNI0212_01948 [Streptococcus pneumoniae PNI0212]
MNLIGCVLECQNFILFENLFKPRQRYLQPQNSVLKPEASFLVCSLIFIEY